MPDAIRNPLVWVSASIAIFLICMPLNSFCVENGCDAWPGYGVLLFGWLGVFSWNPANVEQTDQALVCGRWDGEPVHPRTITHKFVAAIKRLPNLPRVRFHDLRHSHATQLLAAGIHPKIAQERLGHSSITTTLDLYSHVTDTMQNEAASKLNSAFRSAMKAKPKSAKGPQLG